MSKKTSERKMGVQIARQVATIERQRKQIDELENRLLFNQSHLAFHHPNDAQSCGWQRDLMIKLDSMKEATSGRH